MERWWGNPWRRFGLPPRIGWLVVGGYSLAAVLIIMSSIWGWQGAYATRPVDNVALTLCLVFAAACAGYAAHFAVGRRRFGWLALVTALVGAAVGEVIWTIYDVRPGSEHAAHPAAGEIVSFLYPVGAMASMVLLSHASRHSPRRLVLDGLIVATSLFVVSWVFVLDKQLREDNGSLFATLGQVFIDIAMTTTAILQLSRSRPGHWPSRNLLASGIATIAVIDIATVFETGIGSYHVSDLADLGRVAGLAMMALAALSSVTEAPPAVSRDEEMLSHTRLWLPYLPLLLAAAVGLSRAVGLIPHRPMLAALGILVAAVLVRQFVVLIDNQNLLSDVAREALHDSLTGLANRTYFLHRLEQAVDRRRGDRPIAVLCLDLDDFKSVNDALGHPAGDELLIRVAGRLTAALRQTDIIARLGGDEFAVLIEGAVTESQATAQRVLDSFSAPIVIDGVPIDVRPSIGFAVATIASNWTVDQLLRHADLAMYTAKREGGQCVRSFAPDLPLLRASPQFADSAVAKFGPSSAASALAAVAGSHGTAGAIGNELAMPPAPEPVTDVVAAGPEQPNAAPNSIRWPPMAIRIALTALAIGLLAFAVTSALNPTAGHSVLFTKILYPALNLLAAALIVIRASLVRADRLAWSLIAAGMASSAVGDVVYALWVPEAHSPSAADPEYLAFYPFVCAGLLLLMRSRLMRVPIQTRLDALVCALAAAAVATALRAGPLHAAAMQAPATVLVGLAYPWGDLILLTVAAGMLPILGWRNEFRWGLLVAGFIGFTVADAAYFFQTSEGSYRVGTVLDALWPASSLLVAMASWAPTWSAGSSAAPLRRRLIGYYTIPVACTAVALGVAVLGHNSRLAVTLAALSLIAVAARLGVAFRDVRMLAEHHQRAMSDELTKLPNRRSLAMALTAASDSVSAGRPPLATASPRRALLVLNLDGLQDISESIGQHFGDRLLCRIANRLTNSVRREDLLARVSDSEFAILLADGSGLVGARAQAGRLLEALAEPFALESITAQVDACIGIALYPDHCDHPEELLTRAETAIPHARSAIGKIAVYESQFETYHERDPILIEELHAALSDGDQLMVHYQPKINGTDGSVHSVEALLRWQHPRRGLLLPEEFLPAADRAGLMRKVANRTINLALEQIRCWRDRGIELAIAVNLSTTNLLDPDLAVMVERLLQTHELPADALTLEISESALVDSARLHNTVAALQLLGVRISLDDYGTGWSSLARLQEVSVDEIKLDRIFVARLTEDPRSVAIVRSTVALARSLGADLVAEGVEDEATLRALRRYGCTITQGYVHTPPLPPDDLRRWITSQVPNPGQSRPEQRT